MDKHSLVRTIYLYSFSLLGLILIVIGTVSFVNMGLKAWVFTQAEEEERLWSEQPPYPTPIRVKNLADEGAIEVGDLTLTEEERVALNQWIYDYNNWKEHKEKVNTITSRRHRDAASNLSLILVGLPLYLYHWFIIRRENRAGKQT